MRRITWIGCSPAIGCRGARPRCERNPRRQQRNLLSSARRFNQSPGHQFVSPTRQGCNPSSELRRSSHDWAKHSGTCSSLSISLMRRGSLLPTSFLSSICYPSRRQDGEKMHDTYTPVENPRRASRYPPVTEAPRWFCWEARVCYDR
jgi:hypothetical protein